MKIEVYALCWNEEILLPYFLRHYSAFCDKITIYDNFSTDRTLEICSQNPKVTVIPFDTDGQIRNDVYLKIKNNCWKESTADWVIVGDTDEFVYNFFGDPNIEDHTIISPDWWEMVSDHLPTTGDQIWKEINQGVSQGQTTKCLAFRPNAIQEINYSPGAHSIAPVGKIRRLPTSNILILHYKVLSLQYLIERYDIFNKRRSDSDKQQGWSHHYSRSVEELTVAYENLWNTKIPIPVI